MLLFNRHKHSAGFARLLPLQILATVVLLLTLFSLPVYQDFTRAHDMRTVLTDLEIEIKAKAKQTGELPALDNLETVKQYPALAVNGDLLQLNLAFIDPDLAEKILDLRVVKGDFGFSMQCRFPEGVYQNDIPRDHGDYCINAWQALPVKDLLARTLDFVEDMMWVLLAWAGFIAITLFF